VTVTFSSEAGATHTCQLDSNAVINNCTSPRTFSMLTSAMTHSIRIVGTDQFGNVGAATTHNFTVDDVGPTVMVSGSPAANSTVNTTSANLSFSAAGGETGVTFECRFNSSGTFSTCTNFVMSGMIEGAQSLQVRGRDTFGNLGPTTTHAWTIMPLFTTIQTIRTQPVAQGTRVQLNNNNNQVRVTGETNGRFWVQETDGLSTSTNRGITIMPFTNQTEIAPGRSLSITGTVSIMNGNLVLTQSTWVPGSLLAAYNPKNMNRTASNLLQEVNEGMLVNMSGRASNNAAASCQTFDFCIVSCNQSTPVIDSTDGSLGDPIVIGEDFNYAGIVEGNGSGYVYYVNDAQETSDACL
jgi:hypothetical protein